MTATKFKPGQRVRYTLRFCRFWARHEKRRVLKSDTAPGTVLAIRQGKRHPESRVQFPGATGRHWIADWALCRA